MSMEDPIILYIVVNYDLKMSSGKIAAQVGHLIQHLMLQYTKLLALSVKKDLNNIVPQSEIDHIKIITEWVHDKSTKIVKKANTEQWNELKKEIGKNCFIIRDAGRNEIKANSETVLCSWPIHQSQASELVRQLPRL